MLLISSHLRQIGPFGHVLESNIRFCSRIYFLQNLAPGWLVVFDRSDIISIFFVLSSWDIDLPRRRNDFLSSDDPMGISRLASATVIWDREEEEEEDDRKKLLPSLLSENDISNVIQRGEGRRRLTIQTFHVGNERDRYWATPTCYIECRIRGTRVNDMIPLIRCALLPYHIKPRGDQVFE